MIKILFLIPTLGHGGAERVLVNLVNNMDQSAFDITVQTLFDVGIYRDKLRQGIRYKGGLKWYFRGNTIVYKLFTPEQLYKLYVREHYDIIVSYLEGPTARVAAGCNDKETKLISWIHIEQNTKAYASQIFRSEEEAQRCYDRFDRIVCVSETVKKDFTGIFGTGVQTDVLYNTIETEVIRSRAQEKIEDLCLSEETINICSVAKLMHTKGFDRLVRITKKLTDQSIPVHVYVIGKGEERASLEKLIAENGIENNWTFVGFKDNPYKYVAACDLYVCSSRREGFSTAVTESLIVGTPVVSTDCSGAKELLGENDEYGIVTENSEDGLYEGIYRMLTEEGLLAHYREKAAERGRRFSTQDTVRAAEELFWEVMSK